MTDVVAGRFALCDPIARGGSGVVWRAFDRKVGRLCAAKVLRRRDAGDLLRFVREQSVRLSHANVLTPYSWAAEDAHVVIASELVDGGSLSTLITDHGALHEGTVAVVLDQLLAALEAVHDAGLVHRDVKPANLLLRATGTGRLHVLLGDFGLAISEQDARLTQLGMIVGTPGYVAPELLTGTTPVLAGQDLYSAGRVAAALLCGAEPAAGAGQPDLGGVRDPALRSLVEALIEVNPARRPPSAQAARTWLRAHVAADPGPRTRAGSPVDVRDQLPPMPPMPDLLGGSYLPMSAAATGTLGPVPGETPIARAGRRSSRATARTTSGSAGGRAPRRGVAGVGPRGLLLIAATAVAATGASLGIALASSPGSAPSTTAPGGDPPVRVTAADSPCGWQDQNDSAMTPGGAALSCRLTGDTYRWTPS